MRMTSWFDAVHLPLCEFLLLVAKAGSARALGKLLSRKNAVEVRKLLVACLVLKQRHFLKEVLCRGDARKLLSLAERELAPADTQKPSPMLSNALVVRVADPNQAARC